MRDSSHGLTHRYAKDTCRDTFPSEHLGEMPRRLNPVFLFGTAFLLGTVAVALAGIVEKL